MDELSDCAKPPAPVSPGHRPLGVMVGACAGTPFPADAHLWQSMTGGKSSTNPQASLRNRHDSGDRCRIPLGLLKVPGKAFRARPPLHAVPLPAESQVPVHHGPCGPPANSRAATRRMTGCGLRRKAAPRGDPYLRSAMHRAWRGPEAYDVTARGPRSVRRTGTTAGALAAVLAVREPRAARGSYKNDGARRPRMKGPRKAAKRSFA